MEEKSMKKSFSSLGFRFLIGTLVIYAVQMGVMTIVGAVKPEWLQDTTISLILAVLPLYLVGMPVLIAVVKRMPGEAPAKKSITPGQFVLALIMCFALMYCGNLVGTLITTVVGALKGSAVDNALMTYATGSNMIVTFLYMVICAPILEEYIFRKLIVDRTVKYGQGVAVVLSGLMFGLFHGNLNQFAYAFLLGMFLAFLYVKTGELKVTIGLHMCINFMCTVIESNPSGGIPGSHYERGRFTGCHGLHDEVPAGLDRLYDLCIVYSGSIGYGNRIVHCIS
jgi:membrane protease YdiL (CAAX protease family)